MFEAAAGACSLGPICVNTDAVDRTRTHVTGNGRRHGPPAFYERALPLGPRSWGHHNVHHFWGGRPTGVRVPKAMADWRWRRRCSDSLCLGRLHMLNMHTVTLSWQTRRAGCPYAAVGGRQQYGLRNRTPRCARLVVRKLGEGGGERRCRTSRQTSLFSRFAVCTSAPDPGACNVPGGTPAPTSVRTRRPRPARGGSEPPRRRVAMHGTSGPRTAAAQSSHMPPPPRDNTVVNEHPAEPAASCRDVRAGPMSGLHPTHSPCCRASPGRLCTAILCGTYAYKYTT